MGTRPRYRHLHESALPTEKEKGILDQINAACDDYMAAAAQIHARIDSDLKPTTHLSDFADFERQSQRILNLAFQLAMAHCESMNQFLARGNQAKAARWLGVSCLTLREKLMQFGIHPTQETPDDG